jgi:hypothetical protein
MLTTLRLSIILLALTAACSSSVGKLSQDPDSDPDYTRGRTGAGGYAGAAGIQVDALLSPDAEAPAKVETGLDSMNAPDRVSGMEASAPDRQPDVVRQGPEASAEVHEPQDTRQAELIAQSLDVQADAMVTPDLRGAPDATPAADALGECACTDPSRAACVICYKGDSYNTLGSLVGQVDEMCDQSGSRFSARDWSCVICNPLYGKRGSGGLPCPDSMPYCNSKTGACSTTPQP